MNLSLTCVRCKHAQSIAGDPLLLCTPQALKCPSCGLERDARAYEDLASALEDALCLLWRVGQSAAVQIQLSSAELPPAYRPQAP